MKGRGADSRSGSSLCVLYVYIENMNDFGYAAHGKHERSRLDPKMKLFEVYTNVHTLNIVKNVNA